MDKQYFIDFLSAVGEKILEIWDWIAEYIFEIFVIVILGAVIYGLFYALLIAYPQERAQQVELCMRAFEHTRDQCEFIVRNHVAP